ncbi:MAG: hypothetical protein U0264_15650 [Candidatus Kapaibacterium sp.]
MDTPDLIVKSAVAIATAIGVFYQFKNLKITTRSSIKTDLEILKLLDESDNNYSLVKNNIEKSIHKVYNEHAGSTFKIHSPSDFILGVVMIIGFSVLSYYLANNGGYSYWVVITSILAFIGLGGIMNGFDSNRAKK